MLATMNGIELHRLRYKSVEEEPARPGGSPVEAESELVEVVVEMLGTDRFLMRCEQPSLEQRGNPVDCGDTIIGFGVGAG